jgi:hypothetical protein
MTMGGVRAGATPLRGVLVLRVEEAHDPLGSCGERHPVTGKRGARRNCDRQVGLAGAGWPHEHDVLLAQKGLQLGETQDEVVLHAALEGPIELLEGLAAGEARRADARLAAVGFA